MQDINPTAPLGAATAAAGSGFAAQVRALVRWIRAALLVVVGLLVLLTLVEAGRLYVHARDLHPLLGYLVAALLAGGLILLALPVWRFCRVPQAVQPPELPGPEAMHVAHLRSEVRYLDRYLRACSLNPELAIKSEAVEAARADVAAFAARLRSLPQSAVGELSVELRGWGERTIPALVADVDAKVDRLIFHEAVTVGAATAVSPNGTLDAFVMLWRSFNLVSRIAELYYGRPGVSGTLAVCRDVSLATALAGSLQNVSDSLGGLVARSLGGLTGVVAGPAVEGVTNALVLVRVGYLAKARCRSLERWDPERRRSAMLEALRATQKVAVGITGEILRQAGAGLGAVAAGAIGLGQKLGGKLSALWRGGREKDEEPDAATPVEE